MDFEPIYKKYSPKIYRLCLGYINDPDLAKDMTQETFIAVWQHLDSFREASKIGTWIYKIASNKCLRQLEVENKVAKVSIPLDLQDETAQTTDERQVFLRRCIAELPELERLLIGLYLEGVKQDDIAEIIGVSHNNVRVKIHRIKEVLTKKFSNHGEF